MMSLLKRAIPALALFLLVPQAQASLPGVVSHVLPDGGQSWSLPVQTLLFLTLLGFIPALLLMTTSFTRIIIVLGLLRNALGTPSAPPNQVLLGLALFLTFFVMSPVFDKVYEDAYYTHLRAHETELHIVCRHLLDKKQNIDQAHPLHRLVDKTAHIKHWSEIRTNG